MSFPEIVNQMGPFGQNWENSVFRFCRPILDIFGFTLLTGGLGQTSNLEIGAWMLRRLLYLSSTQINWFDSN